MNKFDIMDFVDTQTIQSTTRGIVERERQCRKVMHISQKDLATRSGVSYASIRRFENSGDISLSSLLKIANALDCLGDFNGVFSFPNIKSLKDYKP